MNQVDTLRQQLFRHQTPSQVNLQISHWLTDADKAVVQVKAGELFAQPLYNKARLYAKALNHQLAEEAQKPEQSQPYYRYLKRLAWVGKVLPQAYWQTRVMLKSDIKELETMRQQYDAWHKAAPQLTDPWIRQLDKDLAILKQAVCWRPKP